MKNLTDWLMVIITFGYAITTIGILVSNWRSAKAQQKALEESKKQFQQSIKAQQEALEESKNQFQQSIKAQQEALEESKKQFAKNLELQIQHNFDSVRPAVSVHFSSGFDRKGHFCGKIEITNHGLGPAIIKELLFWKNNNEYKNPHGYCTFYDLINYRLEQEQLELSVQDTFAYYSKEFRYKNTYDRDYLAVDESLTLLEFHERKNGDADIIGKIFHGVEMQLSYTDIYEQYNGRVEKRLSYFKPNWLIDSANSN